MITVTFDEDERQALLLALAQLAIKRPGWDHYLGTIAAKMDRPESTKRRQVEALRDPGHPHVEAGKPLLYERFKVFLGAPATEAVFNSSGSPESDTCTQPDGRGA